MADTTKDGRGFTQEQLDWLELRLAANADRFRNGHGGEISMLKWATGGLFVLGLAATGFLYSEIGSVRDQVQDNTSALARIEVEIDGLKESVGRIEVEIDELKESVGRIEEGLVRIEVAVSRGGE